MRGTVPPLPNTCSWRGAYLSIYVFMRWCLVKHMGFIFTLVSWLLIL